MTVEPFEQRSSNYLQVLIFLAVLTWGFMGFEVAQYRLVNLFTAPYVWIFWATLLFISLLPVLVALSWRLKTSVVFDEPEWDLKEREVTVTEYKSMVKDYHRAYQHSLSMVDYPLILLIIFVFLGALFFPFVTLQTSVPIIAATPVIFGFLFVPFGILFANVIFKFIPNSATPVLSFLQPKQIQPFIAIMSQSPGISWAGVQVTLGEAGGYYTIRNPIPIARVEDIEGVSKIECELNEAGELVKVSGYLQLEEKDESFLVEEVPDELTPLLIARIVQKIFHTYIKERGQQELFEDVLEEVESYLKRHASST